MQICRHSRILKNTQKYSRTFKDQRMNPIKLVAIFIFSLGLMACGSGTETLVYTGVFTDSAVKGLTYKTATQSGITDASGKFKYQTGESIVFSIGNFKLGESATATAVMTPLDLISGALTLPTTNGDLAFLTRKANELDRPFGEGINFAKFQNLLIFLQALDSDKDASNGITIPDGMAALLEGVNINFEANPYLFTETFVLRKVLTEAVTNGLIDNAFIKQPGDAVAHYYDEQEISALFTQTKTRSFDSNADLTANTIYTYTYDANGNRVKTSFDSNADLTANTITTYTYDANGNKVKQSFDSNADLTANTIYTYTYDANGNKVKVSFDSNGDLTANTIDTYTYDANGNRVKQSFDSNADLTANRITTYTYDANGNKVKQSNDSNGDLTANTIYTYTNIEIKISGALISSG